MDAQLFPPSVKRKNQKQMSDSSKDSCLLTAEEGSMKKVCRLDGLGCASCAAKIENAVAKLEGVSSASVNFMTTKLVIEGEDARMDEIMEQATAIVKKVEPDVVVRKA